MWSDRRRLRPVACTFDAELEGPWSLDADARSWAPCPQATHAWILRRPVRVPRRNLHGGVGAGFPDGMPVGLEYRVLEARAAAASRLAGGFAPVRQRRHGSRRGLGREPDGVRAALINLEDPSAMRERAGFE